MGASSQKDFYDKLFNIIIKAKAMAVVPLKDLITLVDRPRYKLMGLKEAFKNILSHSIIITIRY